MTIIRYAAALALALSLGACNGVTQAQIDAGISAAATAAPALCRQISGKKSAAKQCRTDAGLLVPLADAIAAGLTVK